jgi:cation-transporting P-type ATPase E
LVADAITPARAVPWRKLGLVVFAEQLRPNVTDTIAFLRGQGVEVKVLSGDDQQTVAAIARDVGIPVAGVHEGSDIPDDPRAGARLLATQRWSEGSRRRASGRSSKRFAMRAAMSRWWGDGVNDVPALKSSRLAIA